MDMPRITYKIVHELPGRIRLRIPRLLMDADYRAQLQSQLESWQEITKFRLNPAAQSLMVCYDPKKLLSRTLHTQLTSAIELGSTLPPIIHLDQDLILLGCANLTHYEKQKILEINQWLSGDIESLKQGLEALFKPVGEIVEGLIPPSLVEKIFQTLESITDNWQKDWKTLKPVAGVEEHQQLQQVSLDICDRLAQDVKNQAVAQAAVEGGLSGLFGWIGVEINIPLSLLLMWQTIHKIGLCYGYSPDKELQKQFAWAIVEIAISHTSDERKNAFKFWFKAHQVLYPQMLEDWVEESAEAQTTEIIRSQLIKQIIANLIETESGEEIPVIGFVFGMHAEVSLIEAVSNAAYRTFQTRWLIDNKKLQLSFDNHLKT